MTMTKSTSNPTFTRYLVVVPMMDIVDPEPGLEPTAYARIIDAASHAEAQSFAEDFALRMARGRMAWIPAADGLPLADAQAALRGNGFYIGDPIVEPLADVSHVAGARLGS